MDDLSREHSLYIHIPYCRRKCIYCDFFSGGASIADYHLLVTSLLNELCQRLTELLPDIHSKVVSIYYGGGTPSCLPPEEFIRLSEGIRNLIGKHRISNVCEVTIEVNPDDVNPINIETWKKSGINRVSIGIQSLDNYLLRKIGRLHDAETAVNAVKQLHSHFENISCDIMFGLPGQSLDNLKKDISGIIALRPTHISAYSLMYEEGTALTALRDVGRIKETDDSLSSDMFAAISSSVEAGGFHQYEISNYSLPGFESRHNSGYWQGRPYLGIGPSAHSYDGGRIRRSNPRDLKGYLQRFSSLDSEKIFYDEEYLSEKELEEEMIMLRLRTFGGLNLNKFESRFGQHALHSLLYRSQPFIDAGKLKKSSSQLSLTSSGIMISDMIISSLLPD